MDINTAVAFINTINAQPRRLTREETDAMLTLGQSIGERIGTRANATPDELTVLDACQGIRSSDGPSVSQIVICVPGGGDMSAKEYLDSIRG